MKQKYAEIIINEWSDIFQIEIEWPQEIYRGQASAEWDIGHSLGRILNTYKKSEGECWISYEHYLLKEFKRRAHQYEKYLPGIDENVGWLAFMQHHGTPTRLIDFTYSFYIACYFALIEAEGDAAVWMIDDGFLRSSGAKLSGAPELYKRTSFKQTVRVRK